MREWSVALPGGSVALSSRSVHLLSWSVGFLSRSVHLPSWSVDLSSRSVHSPSWSVQLFSGSVGLSSWSVHLLSPVLSLLTFISGLLAGYWGVRRSIRGVPGGRSALLHRISVPVLKKIVATKQTRGTLSGYLKIYVSVSFHKKNEFRLIKIRLS